MQTSHKFTVVGFMILLFFTACGFTYPLESEAQLVLEKRYKNEIKDGTIKITKFRKIDGQSAELVGVKLYTLKYEAEIEYPKGLNPQCKDGRDWGCGITLSFYEIGGKETVKGEVIFQKTENGWQVYK